MSFFDSIEHIDHSLFFAINSRHNAFWDGIMEVVSSRPAWIPAYLFMGWWIWKHKAPRGLYIALLCIGVLILLTDAGSNYLFKHVFERYRPCHNVEFGHLVHTVNDHCGGKFGFISSHAANFFGLAMFFSLLMRPHFKYAFPLFFFLATLVAYSRIYLGVHYPSDVAVGGLFGSTIGWMCYRLYHLIDIRKIKMPV